jgi:hypothetical protein
VRRLNLTSGSHMEGFSAGPVGPSFSIRQGSKGAIWRTPWESPQEIIPESSSEVTACDPGKVPR